LLTPDNDALMPHAHPRPPAEGEMRSTGVHSILIYCSNYKCSHPTAISGDRWPDDVRHSDLEARFVCKACDKRGADIRLPFDRERMIPDTCP
jgi:hypothetical protein